MCVHCSFHSLIDVNMFVYSYLCMCASVHPSVHVYILTCVYVVFVAHATEDEDAEDEGEEDGEDDDDDEGMDILMDDSSSSDHIKSTKTNSHTTTTATATAGKSSNIPGNKMQSEEEVDSLDDATVLKNVFESLAGPMKSYVSKKDLLNWDFVLDLFGEGLLDEESLDDVMAACGATKKGLSLEAFDKVVDNLVSTCVYMGDVF